MTRAQRNDPIVPLFLIATAVADGVRKRGGKLYRISVVRTHSHAYRIKYKCRMKGEPEPLFVSEWREMPGEQWTFTTLAAQDTAGSQNPPAMPGCGVSGDGRTG
ncbi:MAG: hypothetical protein CVV30_04745 [Methanomicrobiales archaeon HGW-Methanomicrobiales-1]|nr:MAG: hypothetical protein CVV30_04745 [Methanomicrobiales archaeon HGW-Methanomicrobiales-1]